MYEDRFSRVVFPLRASHYDTKVALELLIQKNHFLDICNLAFGRLPMHSINTSYGSSNPYSYHSGSRLQAELDRIPCWMDEGNFDPSGATAQKIMKLLEPESNFHTILEHLSVPSSSFYDNVRSGWKDVPSASSTAGGAASKSASSPSEQQDAFVKRWDLPIASVCCFSRQIVMESKDTDLTTLRRERMPPWMMVPFWFPPVVTREEPTSRQTANSMPCTALSYFLLRMLIFVSYRCGTEASEILLEPPTAADSRSQWRWYLVSIKRQLDTLAAKVFADPARKLSKQFVFTRSLLERYLAYYSLESIMGRFVISTEAVRSGFDVQRALDDLPLGVSGTSICLLLHATPLIWLRCVPTPPTELHRTPIPPTDVGSMAALTELFPWLLLLRKQLLPLLPPLSSGIILTGAAARLVPTASAGSSQSPLESDPGVRDLVEPAQALLRYCYVAIRQATMSYPTVVKTKARHYEPVLQLWAELLQTPSSRNGPQLVPYATDSARVDAHVLAHYEAFTFLTGDILTMVSTGSFLSKAQPAALALLLSGLNAILTNERALRILSEVSAAIRRQEHHPWLHAVRQNCILRWQRADGSIALQDFYGVEVRGVVARAIAALQVRVKRDESEEDNAESHSSFKALAEECVKVLGKLFPEALKEGDYYLQQQQQNSHSSMWNASRRSVLDNSTSMTAGRDHSGGGGSSFLHLPTEDHLGEPRCHILSDTDRERFFEGKASACDFRRSMDLKFTPTRQQHRHGGGPISVGGCGDEMPWMVTVATILEFLVSLLQAFWYRVQVPRCPRGHALWLTEAAGTRCNQHHDRNAIWECTICDLSFCTTCRPSPVDPQRPEANLIPCAPRRAGHHCCDSCRVLMVHQPHDREDWYIGYAAVEEPETEGVDHATVSRKVERFYCAACASRPYRKISLRWMATYQSWYCLMISVVSCLVLWLFR